MTAATDLYDSLLEDVYTLTARPDLEGETKLALRTATNNAHFSDVYWRDCTTKSIQLPLTGFTTQLDIPTLFPNFRGINRIQLLDQYFNPLAASASGAIEIVELTDIYDSYGTLRSNIAYLAGQVLNIRSYLQGYGFFVTCYLSPQTKRENYNSWIAQLYPDVIVYWAASIVLDTNGNEAKAAKYMDLTQRVHIPYLKANFLFGELR